MKDADLQIAISLLLMKIEYLDAQVKQRLLELLDLQISRAQIVIVQEKTPLEQY
jgi:hypothetical protein